MRVKVSSRFQIAVPAVARERLGIAAGDYLLIEVREGSIVLVPEPADYSERLRGLHREVWAGVNPDEYVRRERAAWRD